MVRPRLFRRVGFEPGVTYFKPRGIGLRELEESILTVDEFEAVRLKDLQGMEQEESARKMAISQPTFHRLLLSARKKIADAIVNGKAIRIEGGQYKMAAQIGSGRELRRGISPGMGRGRMGGQAAGPVGECACPKCGNKVSHQRGLPCFERKCPKCGAMMTRE